ncbi:membrane protein insertion efficiency factor YidD [Campylobacter sp. MIT 99-7217]|uniref:membrane protein insertion efficiency factor YidD n=1 Tax=Campylobacter sp. MIT 99-7217 TaxID=535091 RepID=UPI00115A58FC|nr:membrane protein insertion efficiency factor YidD [Campylobacter sp. MIT 99-7217]TQR34680.1 membrane protein insertion efficiency factor YidD [Campylobacter sp. MIT 99-7217]
MPSLMIRIYQKFISPLKPACCRFYPSCSEYALWQFQRNNFFLAFILSFYRILRCNPYNKGGFDYPKIYKKIQIDKANLKASQFLKISFFYIPCGKNQFYLVKKLKENRE